jgi:hypothetical protein
MSGAVKISPMQASGVKHFVERAYRESGAQQYLRELVVNALESGAKKIEIMPACEGGDPRERVEELRPRKHPKRLLIADNGAGMEPDDLVKFMNTFGGSGKPIGAMHENFGIGAKTSLLPWNHRGIVVMSWTKTNRDGAMIVIARDPSTGEYGAVKHRTDDGFEEVIQPTAEYLRFRPEWLKHGTIVLCLGNTGAESTFNGKDGDDGDQSIVKYLNKRFWKIEIDLAVFTGEPGGWKRRTITGAAHYAETIAHHRDVRFQGKGTVSLFDGTEIDWYLWEGERPNVALGPGEGYIAALYNNEVYDVSKHANRFRSFGIIPAQVRKNLTLIVRPPLADGKYGVFPDTARNTLKIMGTKHAGEPLPWDDWGQQFSDKLPKEIREACSRAAPTTSGASLDASWRERLASLGDRWKFLRYAADDLGDKSIVPDMTRVESERGRGDASGSGSNRVRFVDLNENKTKPPTVSATASSGIVNAKPVRARRGLPDLEWGTMADVSDEGEEYAAAYQAPSAAHPGGKVVLARDFPSIVEVKQHWHKQYADHHTDVIDATIEEVYGEVMIARVAHSEFLVSRESWGRAKVDKELRSETALTLGVLGLLAEDQMIAERLMRKLGKRKAA